MPIQNLSQTRRTWSIGSEDQTTKTRRCVLFVLLALAAGSLLGPAGAAEPEISDDLLHDQVMRQLVSDRELKILELKVEVVDQVVTVLGYVRTQRLVQRVEPVAKKVKGVRKVVNKVAVRP